MLEEKVNAQLTDSGLVESCGGEVLQGSDPVLATPAVVVGVTPAAAAAVAAAEVAGG
ncbi:hypothetical protein ACFPA8_17135 [Streptomyces ovatisporus]|uniref:Uncharacterized protein n=1 Tax=Streptomyces ovatisporus TaxID=1128682 RepID=A0ABV9A7G9_9ACTN